MKKEVIALLFWGGNNETWLLFLLFQMIYFLMITDIPLHTAFLKQKSVTQREYCEYIYLLCI